MKILGQDVWSMDWFKKCADTIIEYYIKLKTDMMNGNIIDYIKIQIILAPRSGKKIVTSITTEVKEKGEEIKLPLED